MDAGNAAASEISDPKTIRRVLVAASLGTLFEWYDFFLYGSLAVFFGGLFFAKGDETAQLLASLATFGAGFGVRPLGAVVFGHLGDLIGRKHTFLVTMTSMGLSTALIGVLPTYESFGLGATSLLVALRLVQGLALGGEYGGAATYVAEHVPDARRGFYTSFIQTTATLGFFLSMAVIAACRGSMSAEAFGAWGWRVPFLLSFPLLAVSLYIRVKMRESPLFAKAKSAGQTSKNPLRAAFADPVNRRYVLLALFGSTAGMGVVWYTGQFYALTFLQSTLKLSWQKSYTLMSIALAITCPLFVLFGWLSDRVGRNKVMLSGFALAALTYAPIYMGMAHFASPAHASDAALVALIGLQMVYVCMVYGPTAAFLVELFPTQVRYTSMSVPYHLGTGWFGGFLPLVATAVTTSEWAKTALGDGARFAGLAYPIVICAMTLVVGAMFIRETRENRLEAVVRSQKDPGAG